VQRHPVSAVVPFNMLIPLVGISAGLIILGEPLTWQKAVGGLLTLVGVGVIQWRLTKTT
jgi:O-acetylserine/cysteine efflux transporter